MKWLLILAAAAAASGAGDNDIRREWLERQGRYRQARDAYSRSVQRYNRYVMGSGSALGEEAERLRADMEAIKVRSARMRKQLQDMGLPRPTSGQALTPQTLPADPESARPRPRFQRWMLWLPLMLAGALMFLYGMRSHLPRRRAKKAKVKCPGCGQVLQVPQKGRRVRFRCPKCQKEAAYNPQK